MKIGRPPKHVEPRAVFDIETQGWDLFFCGSIFDGSRMRSYRWNQERDMVRDLLALGSGDVFAHNGGRFDFLWFVDALFRFELFSPEMKINCAESGSTIVSMRITAPGIKLQFRDSFRMFPASLARLGGKTATGLDCDRSSEDCAEKARIQVAEGKPATGCGGYCQIRRDMAPGLAARVIEYCCDDSRALWNALHRMIAFAEDDLGLALAGTTGATAWKTAKAWGLIEATQLQDREWHWLRRGYYGGRVGLFRSTADNGSHYDITSSYPYQTSQMLPDGKPIALLSPSRARAAYRSRRPGIYAAAVKSPDEWIPLLPVRAKIKGQRRNAYPTGSFQGIWALPELEHAESIGYRVDVRQATVFPEERDAFRPLMEHLIGARLKYGKDTVEGAIIKLWANSLYGKFAQEPRESHLVLARSSFDVPPGSIPINAEHTAFLVPNERRSPIPDCSHVEKAAYITARGRIQLHTMLTARGGEDAIYCDTDSVFATVDRGEGDGVRSGLGGWADEGAFVDFAAIAPKLYRYDQVRPDGSRVPVVRAKGIALPAHLDALAAFRAWNQIRGGQPIANTTGVNSIRTSIRRGLPMFARKALSRSIGSKVTYGDRIAMRGDRSRPPRARELQLIDQNYDWR